MSYSLFNIMKIATEVNAWLIFDWLELPNCKAIYCYWEERVLW